MSTITNQDPTKIYKQYRRTLKNAAGAHAAQRRQNARATIVEKFGISYADLKALIAEEDAKAGITHEQPQAYIQEQAMLAEVNAAQKDFDANPVPCHCGSTDLVRVRPNHKAWEKDQVVLTTECYACWYQDNPRVP